DDHVRVAIVVHIADAGDVSSERIAGLLCLHRQEHGAVLARIHGGIPAPRSARDYVRDAVLVRVARAFHSDTQRVTGLAVHSPQQLPGFRRIRVDPARGARSAWGGGHDIGDTVAIHVADRPGDPSELVVSGFAIPLAEDLHVFDKWRGEILWRRQERLV